MASKAAGLATVGGTEATVRVIHGDRDSFSRSVNPCATRHLIYHMQGGTLRRVRWSLATADYARETTADGRCVSYLTFRAV